jgi:hypothetical protein
MLTPSPTHEYIFTGDLDLYNSPSCQELATQVYQGRQCQIEEILPTALRLKLCEDGYQAWLTRENLSFLKPADQPYQASILSREEIIPRLPQVIAFTEAARQIPNHYLWGGTLGPNYDCSGLIQRAFASQGIWLPRDSYQMQAFTQPISQTELQAGDLIYFGSERVNHVALYLGESWYIHSSGQEMGRNGIGLDQLSEQGDRISQGYYQKLSGFGRVNRSVGLAVS